MTNIPKTGGAPKRPPAPVPAGTTPQQFLALVQAGKIVPSRHQMIAALHLARAEAQFAKLKERLHARR